MIDVPPESGAAFARALGNFLDKSEDLYVENQQQIDKLRKEISGLESRLKVIESARKRDDNLAIQAGETIAMAGAAGSMAIITSEILKQRVPEHVASTVLDVAGGGGLFLIGKMCFRLIRGNSENSARISRDKPAEDETDIPIPSLPPALTKDPSRPVEEMANEIRIRSTGPEGSNKNYRFNKSGPAF